MTLKSSVPKIYAKKIMLTLHDAGYEAYMAGGCVRDFLLGVEPKDIDIATSATPDQVQELFDHTVAVGAQFGVIVVIMGDINFEVATFRMDGGYSDGRRPDSVEYSSLEEDVKRRDFTINAMMMDIEGNIIDLVGGQQDIQNRYIRAVGDPAERFKEDALRMLRAIRFACKLRFNITSTTEHAIACAAPTIRRVSWERIGDELTKILTSPNPGNGIIDLATTRLLPHVLPEVAAMGGVEQPPEFHPEGDVLTHTTIMLDLMSTQLKDPPPFYAWAVLLHDVGKPLTQTFEDRIRFNEHEKIGADVAKVIMERLHMPNEMRDKVVALVGGHMRSRLFGEMKKSKQRRYVQDPLFEYHIKLHELDGNSTGRGAPAVELARAAKIIEDARPPEPDIESVFGGKDLIEMGYTPGPIFKAIIDAVRDEQLEDRVKTNEDARRFVEERF